MARKKPPDPTTESSSTNKRKSTKTSAQNGTNGAPKKKRRKTVRKWPDRFVSSLQSVGSVTLACRLAKVGRTTVYQRRKADKSFAERWDEALDYAIDSMILEARRRAIEGVEETVYYKGAKIDTVRRHSDVLLMFLIKKERPAYRDGRSELDRDAGELPKRIIIKDVDDRSAEINTG